jgi:hypothetical protein
MLHDSRVKIGRKLVKGDRPNRIEGRRDRGDNWSNVIDVYTANLIAVGAFLWLE